MEFKYYYTRTFLDALEVEKVGNCFIEAFGDYGTRHYLWIKTDTGFSKILEAGPYVDNATIPCKSCAITYDETTFTEPKMNKRISSFLNNPKYFITQAFDKQEEYTEEEKLEKLYNVIKYMQMDNVEK